MKVIDALNKATQGAKGVVWIVGIILWAFWIAVAEPRVDAKVDTLRSDVQFIKRFLNKLHPDLYRETLDEIEQEYRSTPRGAP